MEISKKRRQVVGIVVSDKMNKTVAVLIERLVKHKMYYKYIRRRTKFIAHDENNKCAIGDKVLIEEIRPLSKTKRWIVRQIIEKAA